MTGEHDELPFARICTVSVNVEGAVDIDVDGWLSLLPDTEAHRFLRHAAEAMRDLVAELPEPEEGAKIVSLASDAAARDPDG